MWNNSFQTSIRPCPARYTIPGTAVGAFVYVRGLRIKYGQTDGRRFAQRQPPHFQGAWSARYTLQLQNFIVRNVRIVIYLYDYDVLVLCNVF
jgi:hypothetical protein